MFSPNYLFRITKLYTYACSKATFLLPLDCTSSVRSYMESSRIFSSITPRNPLFCGKTLIQKYKRQPACLRRSFNPLSSDHKSNSFTTNQSYATNPKGQPEFTECQQLPGRISTMQGFKEFFSHPLTWERNNGYFNILLGLAIFGFCFCATCAPDKPKRNAYNVSEKK